MTNEEKVKELVGCDDCPYGRKVCNQTPKFYCHEYAMAMKIAQWKDEQFENERRKRKT